MNCPPYLINVPTLPC